jgi:hypothetical protein
VNILIISLSYRNYRSLASLAKTALKNLSSREGNQKASKGALKLSERGSSQMNHGLLEFFPFKVCRSL